MTALMIDSPWAIGIIVIAALLLFGGTRLAGLGKSAGRAIKEFKDETSGILESGKSEDKNPEVTDGETAQQQTPTQNSTNQAQPTAAPQQNAERN
jgi:sec-independent protein translocase protein TatA